MVDYSLTSVSYRYLVIRQILERGLIHVFSAGGIMVYMVLAFRAFDVEMAEEMSAITVSAIATAREAFDIGSQPKWKSLTDIFSWVIGSAGAAVAIHFLRV